MFRDKAYPIEIPTYTYETETWDVTTFNTKDEFKVFLEEKFKEPGKYEWDISTQEWQAQNKHFIEKGYYCKHVRNSKDFKRYWSDQKIKCRTGVIYKHKAKTWYLTREYYMWLNFLPIYDKEEGIYKVPEIWDVQYHMALYEILAEMSNKHASILKKRQIASSYFHVCKLLNQYWFEEGAKLKMGASLKDYINLKGSWKMLNEYSDHLNEHTAWIRAHNPGKVGEWTQQIEQTKGGRKISVGTKATFTTHTFDRDATTGVGGPTKYFFYEEGGIAPTADLTYEFMRPALKSGMLTTGMFIIAGSVGDLDQCEPLKKFILSAGKNDFYEVEDNLLDEKGTISKHGLFIPEQWSMRPFIDEFGNSMVEEAVEAIKEERLQWKEDLEPNIYQLRISQKPINIKEAFAYREEAIFPIHLIQEQQDRIDLDYYHKEYLDIKKGPHESIVIKKSTKSPIMQFPVPKNMPDKEGCLVVWERPIKDNPDFGTYYASIDPVSEGKTTTSDSLCSIYVYKNTLQITKPDLDGIMRTTIEPGKIVAAWCGRFDDIAKTHERLELIIQWYNSWTLVENNISQFIQHMIAVRKEKYLVPKDQIMFLKSLGANKSVYQDYGWKNTGTLFKNHMISYAVEFCFDPLDHDEDEETGEISKIQYGIERIPDPMLLKEMSEYHVGLNVDRLVTFSALVSFVKIQESNRGYKKIIEEDDYLQKSPEMFKLKKSAFSNIGRNKQRSNQGKAPRSAFRNMK